MFKVGWALYYFMAELGLPRGSRSVEHCTISWPNWDSQEVQGRLSTVLFHDRIGTPKMFKVGWALYYFMAELGLPRCSRPVEHCNISWPNWESQFGHEIVQCSTELEHLHRI